MKKNYRHRLNKCCHNCENSYIKYNYDDPNEYYCIEDLKPHEIPITPLKAYTATDRPPSKAYMLIVRRDWDNFIERREVEAYGICDDYKEKE